MHHRIPLPYESPAERMRDWQRQPTVARVFDVLLSNLAKWTHAFSPTRRYVVYRAVNAFFYFYFKLFNRLRILDAHNVPKSGAIVYITHHSVMDPLILFACFPRYFFGGLINWGNGWFADAGDRFLGLVRFHERDTRQIKVEKMIRVILQKSPHFVIAPEGLIDHSTTVYQGFSSIVDVYATVNAHADRIPFVPVLIRGAEKYHHIKPNTDQITIRFFKPLFLPRSWLNHPDHGGKTPREIIDFLMHRLARYAGQPTFTPNPRLERKHAKYKAMAQQRPTH